MGVKVYRLLTDGIPMWLNTSIELTVTGKSLVAGFQHLVEKPFEQPAAVKPVVVVAERLDGMLSRQIGLRLTGLGDAQVAESEISGKMRLVVVLEERARAGDVRPFREAATPPFVILGNRVKLRKIKRDRPNLRSNAQSYIH